MSKLLTSGRALCLFGALFVGACGEGEEPEPIESEDAGESVQGTPLKDKPDASGHSMTTTPTRDGGAPDATADAAASEADAEAEASDAETSSDARAHDAGATAESSFAAVYALLEASCTGCHNEGKLLDFSTPAIAYASLIDVPASYKACATTDGGTPLIRVVPGAPESSLLIQKLENHQTCGKQMPTMQLLPAADVAVFRAWVAAGAPAP